MHRGDGIVIAGEGAENSLMGICGYGEGIEDLEFDGFSGTLAQKRDTILLVCVGLRRLRRGKIALRRLQLPESVRDVPRDAATHLIAHSRRVIEPAAGAFDRSCSITAVQDRKRSRELDLSTRASKVGGRNSVVGLCGQARVR